MDALDVTAGPPVPVSEATGAPPDLVSEVLPVPISPKAVVETPDNSPPAPLIASEQPDLATEPGPVESKTIAPLARTDLAEPAIPLAHEGLPSTQIEAVATTEVTTVTPVVVEREDSPSLEPEAVATVSPTISPDIPQKDLPVPPVPLAVQVPVAEEVDAKPWVRPTPKPVAKPKPTANPELRATANPASKSQPESRPSIETKPASSGTVASARPVAPSRAATNGSAVNAGARRAASQHLAGVRADYLSRLQGWLERHKRYPRRARRRRQEGTALLRVVMSRDGTVISQRLERSSGHAALDREVKAMLKRAQPLPKMPPEMSGDRLELVVPVQFALR